MTYMIFLQEVMSMSIHDPRSVYDQKYYNPLNLRRLFCCSCDEPLSVRNYFFGSFATYCPAIFVVVDPSSFVFDQEMHVS